MDMLRLKPRQPVEEAFEDWDDDDFMIEEDITFRSTSTSANAASRRRDSRSSFRSDFESVHAEEEKQVHLPGDDEKSTLDAIAVAAKAGIPIPKDVPPSALMGGTIKRLGGQKIKQFFQDDWDDDLEFPDGTNGLHIKPQDSSKFPDVLRQVSGGSAHPSPSKPTRPSPVVAQPEFKPKKPNLTPSTIDLDRFRDTEDDNDFFGDGSATIKAPKTRQAPKPISLITPPTPQKKTSEDDDFENDLELPSDGKLKLSKRKEIPKTPSMNILDDFDWGEGSLGTRFGGTRRDGRSNRSSSVSALSPSVSSSLTLESEDEAFDGLVIPSGPVNFGERLKRRRPSRSPQRFSEDQRPQSAKSSQPAPRPEPEKEDFLTGLDLGDGDVFTSSKLTLHRNVKVKDTRPASPSRPKTAVSLTFTNKPVTTTSRLPRPMVSHERTHTQSSLEPVSESGAPIYNLARRSQSRLGHSAQSSISSIPTPTTPSSAQSLPPSTPQRKEVGQKTSAVSLRSEATTTSAQLLRYKRSLPVMRQPQSPARPLTSRGYERPPSRTDTSHSSRSQSAIRPKTPVDRTRGYESAAAQARKNPLPFLPAGASHSQSQHVTAKSSRVFRRHDSDPVFDLRPSSRAVSRSTMRSPSPSKKYRYNAEKVAQEGLWQHLNKPRRARHFGDGHELDGFDDLPTSTQTEARFTRQPIATGPKLQLRSKIYQNIMPDRTNTSSPLSMCSPAKSDYVPSFARDTAASRMAREASLAHRAPSGGPLAQLTAQRVAQLSSRNNPMAPLLPNSSVRSKKNRKLPQLKPHLISNLNSARESKSTYPKFHNSLLPRPSPSKISTSPPPPPQITTGASKVELAKRASPSKLPLKVSPSKIPEPIACPSLRVCGSPTNLPMRRFLQDPSKKVLTLKMRKEALISPVSTAVPPFEATVQSSPFVISREIPPLLDLSSQCAALNGMFYNPVTMRWEGNENALSAFDVPASSPSTASLPPYLLREKENATPRPALITPIGATKGVQVVGGMVFDPQNMCWLKLGPQTSTKSEISDPMDGFNAIDSDEDVFKDIPDLDDTADSTEVGTGRVSDVKDDWLVGEEFDVGPEFIRRQRDEEGRWKKKCEKWLNFEDRDRTAWRWALRDLIVNPR